MSFNNNDNKPLIITPANYEEYFLMYVDDELTAEEKTAVEKFAELHPHLGEELQILLSTKLTDDVVPFEGKESLLAGSMKLSAVEEKLLLYIDDELKGPERTALEKRLQTTPEVQAQYGLLLKTKLDKSEEIIYPYKKDLYQGRKTERPVYWMRIAAAIILVAGMGTFALLKNGNKQVRNDVAHLKNPEKVQTSTGTPTVIIDNGIKEQPATEMAVNSKPAKEVDLATAHKAPLEKAGKKAAATVTANVRQQDVATVENKKMTDFATNTVDVAISPTKNTQPENNLRTGVTSATTAAYNPVEASDNEIIDAVATSENKKGRAIRGFLRKATRFIERTTNIDPVNEDDKLLIGAVALKLK
jgi:hypothetical protein